MADTEYTLREIDFALAALADVKPLADYGQPGTYDTVQARRKNALERAERSLLNVRRELSAALPATSLGEHEPGPLLMFSLNYINGFMVGESDEVRRHWKRVYAHFYGLSADQQEQSRGGEHG